MIKLLSVIIPAYNVEKFLNKCVESVVNQTYKNIEIIIVDDGSQDSTPKICDELAAEHDNIKVIHKANQGTSRARQTGVNASSGEYIAFIDTDDYIDLNAYAKAVKVLEDNNCDIVQFGVFRVSANEKIILKRSITPLELNHQPEIFAYFFQLPGSLWDKVYRRELFDNFIWLELTFGEDFHILMQVLSRANKLIVIPEHFYYNVQNPQSVTHSPYSKKAHEDCINSGAFTVSFTEKNFPAFLPHALWHALERMQLGAVSEEFLSDNVNQDDLNNLKQIMREYYTRFKSELAKRDSDFNYDFKRRVRTWVSFHCPVLFAAERKLKGIVKAVTGL